MTPTQVAYSFPLGEAAPAGEDGQEDHAAPAAEEAVGQPRRSAGDPRRPAMFHVIPPFLKDVSGGASGAEEDARSPSDLVYFIWKLWQSVHSTLVGLVSWVPTVMAFRPQ